MIIIASRSGQLGNSLFLFAHFVAFAHEHHLRLVNPSFEDYAHYFENLGKTLLCAFPATGRAPFRYRWLRRLIFKAFCHCARVIDKLGCDNAAVQCTNIGWNEFFDMDEESAKRRIAHSRLAFVQGWQFRCPALMRKHFDEIKSVFLPVEPHRANVHHLVSGMRTDCDVLIGIHVRHGDYENYEGGKYYFEFSHYKKIMQRAIELFPEKKTRFLVCTNSEKDSAALEPLPFSRGSGQELEDMYALAACDYIIGPPSTFSMWASYYGKVPLLQLLTRDIDFTLNDFKITIH